MTNMLQLERSRGFGAVSLSDSFGLAGVDYFAYLVARSRRAPAATQAAQKTFAAPDDAGKALGEAAKADNRDTLLIIFGPGSKDVIYSGDAEEDKAAIEGFAAAYAKHEPLAQAGLMALRFCWLATPIPPFPFRLRKTALDSGTSIHQQGRTRSWRGALAATSWQRSMCPLPWPTLRWNTSPRSTMALRNTLRNSSAMTVSKMACTGSRRRASPRAR